MAKNESSQRRGQGISRRQLLVGGGIGAGLVIGWTAWPRSYRPALVAEADETVFNAFLKIAADGRVTIAVPQAEFGQGSYTALPQILADELGADWRTIAVEAAPVSPLYANRVLAGDWAADDAPAFLQGVTRWAAQEYATRDTLMISGFSSSVRAFEQPLREAGAGARVLLCKAAARRWEADWLACDTAEGFVVRGEEKIRFGELVAEALAFKIPDPVPLRTGAENRLTGQSLPRLDLPAKIDGSAQFSGDIRLPDMVFAAIRQAPAGTGQLLGFDRKAADAVRGVLAIVDTPAWVAAVANNWWAANTALDKMKPRFAVDGARPTSQSIAKALDAALAGDGVRVAAKGDLGAVYANQSVHVGAYSAGLAAHAPMETMSATARFRGGRLELWIASQTPSLARRAAAAALNISESNVTLHQMMGGGSFGRRLENEAAAQVAVLAARMKRPVQLSWSRAEDIIHDPFRPPALARLSAKLGPTGLIQGWQTRIASPLSTQAQMERMFADNRTGEHILTLFGGGSDNEVAGALPSYALPAYAIDHHPADIGVPTGYWRGGAHGYTAFFTESFIDELAHAANVEPLSFRMQLLGNNVRLARCLTTVASMGGWEGGGPGTGQGLACHSMAGSHVALMAEAGIEGDRVRVYRIAAVVDCGRVIHPDLVKQQIEGGICFGIAAALGAPIDMQGGMAVPRNFAQLAFPKLADMPEISVQLIRSHADPGGVSEIALPPVAPAIANALFAANGRRPRSLPFSSGTS